MSYLHQRLLHLSDKKVTSTPLEPWLGYRRLCVTCCKYQHTDTCKCLHRPHSVAQGKPTSGKGQSSNPQMTSRRHELSSPEPSTAQPRLSRAALRCSTSAAL